MEYTAMRKHLLLYGVTDRRWLRGRSLAEQVRQALAGGVTMLQLREKDRGHASYDEAREIQELCRASGVPLIVDDDVELALRLDADGVHVGQKDMPAREARALLGAGKILGVSARTVEQAKAAQSAGADYLGVGAVFPTGTKGDAIAMPHALLREISASVQIPVAAIGGISADNIMELAGTGIAGVAVVSALFAQEDILGAAQKLRRMAEQVQGTGNK